MNRQDLMTMTNAQKIAMIEYPNQYIYIYI